MLRGPLYPVLPKSRLVILVDKALKQKGMLAVVVLKSLVPLFGRAKRTRGDYLLCYWILRIERIATHRIHLGHTIEEISLCRSVQYSTWYDCPPLTPGFMIRVAIWHSARADAQC
jgi:hypothetical protein